MPANMTSILQPTDQRVISTFKVQCKNKNKNCSWTGIAMELEQHINENCLKQSVHCPNNGCNETFLREEMNQHMSSCSFRTSFVFSSNF